MDTGCLNGEYLTAAVRDHAARSGWQSALRIAVMDKPIGTPEWFVRTCRKHMPKQKAKPITAPESCADFCAWLRSGAALR